MLCCTSDIDMVGITVDQARDMVGLVNKFAAKLEEKKGALTEDEVSQSQCVYK